MIGGIISCFSNDAEMETPAFTSFTACCMISLYNALSTTSPVISSARSTGILDDNMVSKLSAIRDRYTFLKSGPIIGAIIATLIPELFNAAPDLKLIVYGALLVIIPQVLPAGIAGTIKKHFREIDDNQYIMEKRDEKAFDIKQKVVRNDNDFDNDDILIIKNLTKKFGGHTAVEDLNMTIKRGTVHSLIGPNGAGKTTTLNVITGVDKPSAGTIIFKGKDITGKSIIELVRQGISRTFQHVRLFNNLSYTSLKACLSFDALKSISLILFTTCLSSVPLRMKL